MRFLVDAQLPRRLVRTLHELGHDTIHTSDLPHGNRTSDGEIGLVADRDDRIVVSKDADFRDSHLVRGTPRRLLKVTTGNIRNDDLIALFALHMAAIEAGFGDANLVEMTADELVVHDRRA